jgi:hypothetical protein
MDKTQEETKKELAKFAGHYGPAAVLPATVLSVNDDDTVEIEFSDGAVVDDARLKSVVKDGNKFLLVPAVNSIVLVAKIENSDEYYVIAVDEITEVLAVIGNTKVQVNATGLLFERGNDTLGKVLQDLIAEVLKIYAPMNKPVIAQIKLRADQLLK